tara:strand:- start:281 stop:550 length:270 start_codon:yes stop_codon:yes gene_type:complete
MSDIYERALDFYNKGTFLQLEGSIGRSFVRNFLDTGIIKTLDEVGSTVVDGYGRTIQLKKAVIDDDRIDELRLHDTEFIMQLENEYDES